MRIHRLLLAAFLFLAPSIAAAQIVVPVGGGGSGVPSIAGTTNQINESGSPGATTLSLSSTIVAPGTVTIPSGDLILNGSGSGSSTLNAPATGGGTVTLPAGSVGIVAGPASAVSGHIATFSGTSGQIIQDGGAAGTGTVTSVGCGTGLLCSTAPITTTGTITPTIVQNAQTGTSYATLATDANKVVSLSNTSAQAVSLSQATTTGFTAGFGTEYDEINTGIATITATTSVFDNGLTTLALAQGQDAFVWSDGTNYHSVVSTPVLSADSLLGNFSATNNYPIGGALSSCSGATNALTYNTTTHAFGCNTISGSGTVNSGTAGDVAYYATSTNAVSDGAGAVIVNVGALNVSSSTAAAPANGLRYVGSGDMRIMAGGTNTADVTSSNWQFNLSPYGSPAGSWALQNSAASGTVPTLTPNRAASTTGIGAAASGDVNIIAAATDMMQVTSSAITFPGITPGAGAQTGYWCYNTGPSFVAESVTCVASLEEYKNKIAPITGATALSDVLKLQPFWGTWNQKTHPDADKAVMPFLGAHQVASIDKRLAIYDTNGKLSGVRYSDGGLVALYAAAIQEQQKEIDRLWLAFSALLITWGVSFGYLYRRAA